MVGFLMVWGLIFSRVTIAKLGVAFDYDDTLVFSTPAYEKAFAAAPQALKGSPSGAMSRQFWSVVNQAYDLEKPKIVPLSAAWLFRVLGFRVAILASRPDTDGEALRKEWRRLVPRPRFIFAGDGGRQEYHLEEQLRAVFRGLGRGHLRARKAGVFPVRVKRSLVVLQEDYHPGVHGFVLPCRNTDSKYLLTSAVARYNLI